ncbi:hypothetical protein HMPREF1148_2220 [Selenomonas sp. FOBRC6]|nr:hypothetical protein HMPREF1148_2220 [Selenomonas sp. FOBRC6]
MSACQNHCQALCFSHRYFSPHGYRVVSPTYMQWQIGRARRTPIRFAVFLPISMRFRSFLSY